MRDTWLTPEQLADLMQLKKAYVWRLCREKRIPHHRLGREIRFSQQDVMSIVAMTKVDVLRDQGPVPVGRR